MNAEQKAVNLAARHISDRERHQFIWNSQSQPMGGTTVENEEGRMPDFIVFAKVLEHATTIPESLEFTFRNAQGETNGAERTSSLTREPEMRLPLPQTPPRASVDPGSMRSTPSRLVGVVITTPSPRRSSTLSTLVGVVITTPSSHRGSTIGSSPLRMANGAFSSTQSTPSKALARSLSQIAIANDNNNGKSGSIIGSRMGSVPSSPMQRSDKNEDKDEEDNGKCNC